MMKLIYINELGPDYKGHNIYEFIFSKDMDVWGEKWESKPSNSYPSPPDMQHIHKVGILKNTDVKLTLIQNSDYFSMEEALDLMNEIAPEHLEVMTKNPFELLPFIKHAGAIFLGENTPEPIGDYLAGPNHTLPTGSTAKFYSPLNVENFMKKSSIINFSKNAINELGEACALLADTEGLTAHAKAVRVRLENK